MNPPIVSQEQIIKAAGQLRYEQGREDSERLSVQGFQCEGKIARAAIGEFETQIRYQGEIIEGSCNCPDSDGFDFCRHCVTLTLHANRVAQQLMSLSKGPDKSKVLAYLLSLDKQVLAKQFLELIEQDAELLKRFLLKASLGNEQINYTDLKGQVTQLTRVNEKLFSQRQVKHFFSRIERFLEELALSVTFAEPEKMLKVIEYAFQRLAKLLANLNDRGNHQQESVELLCALYQRLLQQVDAKDNTKARRFYNFWIQDREALLGHDLKRYLSDTQCTAFVATLNSAWKKHLSSNNLSAWQAKKIAHTLIHIDTHNETPAETLTKQQALRAYLAQRPEDWIAIAQHWESHGDIDKAIDVLERQLDRSAANQAILARLITMYQAHSSATEHLMRLFETHPLQVAPALSFVEDESKQRALRSHCTDILIKRDLPDEAELLVQLLIQDKKIEQVSQLALNKTLSLTTRIELSDLVASQYPELSSTLLEQAIRELLSKQLSKADRKAAELLFKLQNLLGESKRLHNFLEALRPLLQARPNFIRVFRELNQAEG